MFGAHQATPEFSRVNKMVIVNKTTTFGVQFSVEDLDFGLVSDNRITSS